MLGRTGWGGRSAALRPPPTTYQPVGGFWVPLARPALASALGLVAGGERGEQAPGRGGYRVLGVTGSVPDQLVLTVPPTAAPPPTFGATMTAPVRRHSVHGGSRLAPMQVDGGEDEVKKEEKHEDEEKQVAEEESKEEALDWAEEVEGAGGREGAVAAVAEPPFRTYFPRSYTGRPCPCPDYRRNCSCSEEKGVGEGVWRGKWEWWPHDPRWVREGWAEGRGEWMEGRSYKRR